MTERQLIEQEDQRDEEAGEKLANSVFKTTSKVDVEKKT